MVNNYRTREVVVQESTAISQETTYRLVVTCEEGSRKWPVARDRLELMYQKDRIQARSQADLVIRTVIAQKCNG